MADIPDLVQRFIFDHIDSIEQLEILLLLRLHSSRAWNANEVSDELRTNPGSAGRRLADLKSIGLLQDDGAATPSFKYAPANPGTSSVIDALAEARRVQRHKVYELVFSPLKRSKDFSEAFRMRKPRDGGGGDD